MLRSLIPPFAAIAFCLVAGSAQSAIIIYQASMSGGSESPPTGSPATGFTTVTIDDVLNSLTVDLSFSGLTGGSASAAHIHCCTPVGTNTGVAVPYVGFPGTASGTYNHTFDLLNTATYTSAFLTASGGTAAGAEATLLAGLASDRAYSNIHNSTFQNGEIRGFLTPVPEPAAWALMVMGLGLTGAALRRRHEAAI